MAGAGVPDPTGPKLVLPREMESVVRHTFLDMAEAGIKWHPGVQCGRGGVARSS